VISLGISAFYHDSAAAIVRDGDIIAAAQEERFTRKRHDSGFPARAIRYCLEEARVDLNEVDQIAFYDKPFLKFERLLETYLAFSPRGFRSFRMAIPLWLKEKLFQKKLLADELADISEFDGLTDRLLFTEHHLSHAASAFFPSPFERAAILTMDGVGEWATTSMGVGAGNTLALTDEWATTSLAIGNGRDINVAKEIHFPHSIGLLYSAFTYYTGFKVNSGEYKVMGLAPYGEPKYAQLILDKIVDLKPDGSFRLNQDYFDYCTGLTMTNAAFDDLFGAPARSASELLTPRHMDLAASVQTVTEEIVLRLTRSIAAETGERNLCLAGGVALNCVANGKVLRDGKFDRIWIQPAAGDAGGALGAALAAQHMHDSVPRTTHNVIDAMKGAYLGPSFSDDDAASRLFALGATLTRCMPDEMITQTIEALTGGKAVGWFQGRMEFGPRALGARSILGDARSAAMQRILNLKVKYRESFRPFAPSVLREDVADWFELDDDSPYMLLVADVVEGRRRAMTPDEQNLFGIDKLNVQRSDIPAVTHVDYSARVQTVHRETNPVYWQLLSAFKEVTGCPVLVNTSFNVRGEPIVCTPEEAFRCFMGTEIEMLVVGNCVLHKEQQNPALKSTYHHSVELD
jgi:carbamoyltransferase